MNNIEKSYLSVFPLLLLLIFPGLVRWVKIKTRVYTYDSKNLYIEEGVFSKDSMTIPLIKIESIQARSNILGNGTIRVNAKVGSEDFDGMWGLGEIKLKYIKNAKGVMNQLWQAVENARTEQGVKSLDTF